MISTISIWAPRPWWSCKTALRVGQLNIKCWILRSIRNQLLKNGWKCCVKPMILLKSFLRPLKYGDVFLQKPANSSLILLYVKEHHKTARPRYCCCCLHESRFSGIYHLIDRNCTTIFWNMINIAIPWVTVGHKNN